jgi:hypothetical protein
MLEGYIQKKKKLLDIHIIHIIFDPT